MRSAGEVLGHQNATHLDQDVPYQPLVLPAVLDAAPGGPDADQGGRDAASISFMNQLVGSVQGRQVDIYDQSRVWPAQSADS